VGRKPNWTKEELGYLEDAWGRVSISGIAKKLGRSVEAVKLRAHRHGLKRHLHAGEYPTLEQVWAEIGIQGSTGYNTKRFIALGLPVHWHRVIKSSFRVVHMDEFWKWAEQHKRLLDFRNFGVNALGAEPDWVKQKRAEDVRNFMRPHNSKWTPCDDDALRKALKTYRYTYADLSVRLNRSEGAVKRRIYDLRLRERPVRVYNRRWTDEEVSMLLNFWDVGYSYERIAVELGRTALQVRGKHERLLNPERQKRSYRNWREIEKQRKAGC
jgi:hypothetical protein